MAYAEGTKVPVDNSRGEITKILTIHGCTRMATGMSPEGDTIQFELDGKHFRFFIEHPTAESMRIRDSHKYSYPHNVDWDRKAEDEWKRRWRAHVLLIKAKLEFIDGGDTSLEAEFMPYIVLSSGQTLGEFIAGGGVPLLTGGK